MTELFLGRGAGRKPVRLGKLLGEGAAGKVHALPGMPGVAAKIYHGADAGQHEAKIDAMLANPPDLPPAVHEGRACPQIAWPQAKLFDAAGRFAGFLMPEIDFARSTSLVNLLQKNSRRVEKLSDYYGYRVLVARNLAAVFAELHRAGHYMIDMKPANLRFYPAVSWMAVVDADGFSVAANPSGTRARIGADRVSDEFIAPESWKKEPHALGEPQDRFALAVIVFQLLNNGVHPFAGTAEPGVASDLQTRILNGVYPHAQVPQPGLAPATASVHRMFRRSTRILFDRAFLGGGERPSAVEWRDHLDLLLGQLVPCAAKPGEHAHFGAGCGFCSHEGRVAAARAAQPPRKPAPRPAAPRPPLQLQHQLAPVQAPVRRKRRARSAATIPALLALVLALAVQDEWGSIATGIEAQAAGWRMQMGGREIVQLDVPEAAPAGDGMQMASFGVGTAQAAVPADGSCAATPGCTEAMRMSRQTLEARYDEVLMLAPQGRAALERQRDAWSAGRRRCSGDPDEAGCILAADARWSIGLEDAAVAALSAPPRRSSER
jgi:DNA-binding helix-hairpin-helix protein with protein kinase domain